MKFFLTLLALSAMAITSCERHDFEETKKLHESHDGHEARATEGHSEAEKESGVKAEH